MTISGVAGDRRPAVRDDVVHRPADPAPAGRAGTNGKKEQHLLHKVGDGVEPASAYLDLFPADGSAGGTGRRSTSGTPPPRPRPRACWGRTCPVLVLLRDPVERFLSAMRLAATRAKSPWPYPVPITVQTFSGFYADQLAMWAHHVGRERMVVMVFESVRAHPRPRSTRSGPGSGSTRWACRTSTDRPGRAAARPGRRPPAWWSRWRCSTARRSAGWPTTGDSTCPRGRCGAEGLVPAPVQGCTLRGASTYGRERARIAGCSQRVIATLP